METKKKILIIEDETPLSNALAAQFVDEGFAVVQAYDGEEGLAMVLQEAPDVILLDLLMPRMSGDEMLRRLQATNSKNIPVVVLSNSENMDAVADVMKAGVFHYLTKVNSTLADIVAKVRSVVV